MKKRLFLLVVPALASCGFQMPKMDENAWLAFNQDFKELSYNKDRIPEQRFFDVHFKETADVHLSTDPSSLNSTTLSLTDLQDQSSIPLKITLKEHRDALLGVTGRYVELESLSPLKYNHSYRLKATRGIKTTEGRAMPREETYDFQTEKEPLELVVLADVFDPQNKTLEVTLRNKSAFPSSGLLFEISCLEPVYREYHAYLQTLNAGATATLQMKLIDGSIENSTPPSGCRPLKAYDFLAEREIQVNP